MSIYKGSKKIAGIGDITQDTWDADIGNVDDIAVVVNSDDDSEKTSINVVESLNILNATTQSIIDVNKDQGDILADHETRIQTLEDNESNNSGLADNSVDTQHFAEGAVAPYAEYLTETLPTNKGGTGNEVFDEGEILFTTVDEDGETPIIASSGISAERVVKYNLLSDIDESDILSYETNDNPDVTEITSQDFTAYDSTLTEYDVSSISEGTMVSAVVTLDNVGTVGTEENGYISDCDFNLRIQAIYSDGTVDAASATDSNFDGYLSPGESGSRVARVIIRDLGEGVTLSQIKVLYRNASGTSAGDTYIKVYRFGVFLGDYSVDALLGTGYDIESTARIYGINQTNDGNLYFPGTIQSSFEGSLSGTATRATYLGSSDVGSWGNPIYLDNGTPKSMSGCTRGGTQKPIWLNSGSLEECETGIVGSQNLLWVSDEDLNDSRTRTISYSYTSYVDHEDYGCSLNTYSFVVGDYLTFKVYIVPSSGDAYTKVIIYTPNGSNVYTTGTTISEGSHGWSTVTMKITDSMDLYGNIRLQIVGTSGTYYNPMLVKGSSVISGYNVRESSEEYEKY